MRNDGEDGGIGHNVCQDRQAQTTAEETEPAQADTEDTSEHGASRAGRITVQMAVTKQDGGGKHGDPAAPEGLNGVEENAAEDDFLAQGIEQWKNDGGGQDAAEGLDGKESAESFDIGPRQMVEEEQNRCGAEANDGGGAERGGRGVAQAPWAKAGAQGRREEYEDGISGERQEPEQRPLAKSGQEGRANEEREEDQAVKRGPGRGGRLRQGRGGKWFAPALKL